VGEGFSRQLIATTAHPVMGLVIGVLSTAIIQSSSTTTSIVVGMVAGGALTVRCAIPIIMGANLGTTITCTLVAMAALNRRTEFQRSFAAATMHDFFNLLTILILFPLEQATHVLEKGATWLSARFVGVHNPEFSNPVKEIVEPLVDLTAAALTGNLKPGLAATAMIVLALAGIFLALLFLTKLLKRVVLSRAEGAFAKHLRGNEGVAMLMGLVITAIVQSSSVTTSLLVPLVGAGIVPIGPAFATALGANVGTTVTAILASLTGTADAVTVAFVHLLFNVGGS
jgi:sodium-dependent phosphate cotransporter